MHASRHEVTGLLSEVSRGDDGALERLVPLVYDELRAVAARQLRRERPDHTLQTTALVNEAYLKLVGQRSTSWRDRAHFFAAAATSIRQILIDYARTRGALKRGRDQNRVSLEEVDRVLVDEPRELLAIDEALLELAAFDARKARIVELRFFAGLEVEDVAEVMGISSATVKRDWSTARAWLQARLDRDRGEPR